MLKRNFSLDKLLKDPLFWSILLLNLFVVFRYGSNIEFLYNLVVIQIIQTFCLIVAHYFLIRNTPIKYLKKKYRLNRTRKKTDKNRKEFGSYIDKDETGDSIFAAIFLIMGCFVSVFMLAIFYAFNLWKNEGEFVFQWSDLLSSFWAIANGILYYQNNKKRLTYSNASASDLIAIPFFKFYIPLFAMLSGYILVMKVVGDIISFILSNPKYWENMEEENEV
ncbi:hypothetical protein SAMN05660477_00122 [Soonwooa buanensis]|uniref:Uncharacterized protein n=1 Tax=Soonwooa buanensis TaxID=619805 RepID=A0A1T5CKB3_9FLAO|nr:hypothetical protein [Soonwooa buanensis]SKB59783.1 hypothetical protein SAMN05660477_00122 [Soonwooa buanensis]